MTRWKRWLAVPIVIAAAAAAQNLDEGLLDPAWYGKESLAFHTNDEIDYFWVKDGLSLAGRSLHIQDWSDPVFLGKQRDAKDAAKASSVTEQMPGLLRGALSTSLKGVTVSRQEGDIAVTGRVVDCNAGSKGAKMWVGMGAGSASATWDLKFTDVATGELLLAVHHRAISGTMMSEIEDKVIKWLEEFGALLAGDPAAAYARAKPAKK